MAACATLLGSGLAAEPVTVFAAASLKNALDEVADEYRTTTGANARIVYAGSSSLARQIQAGAPADLFISANTDWMKVIVADGLANPEGATPLLSNRLVLVAPATAQVGAADALGAYLAQGRIAIALVEAVPAGIYGKQALTSLGLWEDAQSRLVQVDNVRAALRLVALGEVPWGIVYLTDARAENGVQIVGTFSGDSHDPIRYPVAVLRDATQPDSTAMHDLLTSPTGAAIFERHGFGVLTAPE